jgi:hypothetical protein
MEASNMAGARTATASSNGRQPVLIIAASDMDTEQFALHFTKRHKSSLAGAAELPSNIDFGTEQSYRAFHSRLHSLRTYRHEHEPDAPEVGIDRALECLFENHNWGWKQLAGVPDKLVAVFPNGQIAVKFTGVRKPRYFDEIDEATDALLGLLVH